MSTLDIQPPIGQGRKIIQIVSLSDGTKTPFDGKYLKEYDPMRDGMDPAGDPMSCHLVAVDKPEDAAQFSDAGTALACWRQRGRGWRHDGEWNRPLTAFTVQVLDAPSPSGQFANPLDSLQ